MAVQRDYRYLAVLDHKRHVKKPNTKHRQTSITSNLKNQKPSKSTIER
jgi:hypothetical protein